MRRRLPSIAATSSVIVQADAANTGKRPGDDGVPFSLHDEVSSVNRPVKELGGFERMSLNPGGTRTVTFMLGTQELGFHSHQMQSSQLCKS